MSAVERDIIVADGLERIGPLNAFLCRVVGVGADALAQPSELVRVGFVPHLFVFRMFA